MSTREHHGHDDHHGHGHPHPPRVVTLTISDTRTEATDVAGRTLRELLSRSGCTLLRHTIVTDDPEKVIAEINRAIDEDEADAVVCTGGTGIASRDQTYEAMVKICDKTLDGFGEAFRRLSWEEVGPRAILSRAMAGVYRRTVLIALPGSPAAVTLGIEGIVGPTIGHMVALVKKP